MSETIRLTREDNLALRDELMAATRRGLVWRSDGTDAVLTRLPDGGHVSLLRKPGEEGVLIHVFSKHTGELVAGSRHFDDSCFVLWQLVHALNPIRRADAANELATVREALRAMVTDQRTPA